MGSSLPPDVRKLLEDQGILQREQETDPNADVSRILQDMGLTNPAEEGTDYLQPIKTAFATGPATVGRAIGAAVPEQYAAARAELEKQHGITPESPWYKKLEASPALGDIAAQFVPQEVRESRLGTALGPIGRLGGNILGDPLTYTPWLLAKGTGAVIRSVPEAATALEEAGKAEQARRAFIGPLSTAAQAAQATSRTAEADAIARAVMQYGSPLQRQAYRAGSIIQTAEPIAVGSAAALAYGPAALRGAWEGWKQVGQGITQQPLADTAAEGVNALLQTGLSAMMAHGLISAGEGAAAWNRHLRDSRPADAAAVEQQVGQVGGAVQAAVEGAEPQLPPELTAAVEGAFGPAGPPRLGAPPERFVPGMIREEAGPPTAEPIPGAPVRVAEGLPLQAEPIPGVRGLGAPEPPMLPEGAATLVPEEPPLVPGRLLQPLAPDIERFIAKNGGADANIAHLLQRRFRVGYSQALSWLDEARARPREPIPSTPAEAPRGPAESPSVLPPETPPEPPPPEVVARAPETAPEPAPPPPEPTPQLAEPTPPEPSTRSPVQTETAPGPKTAEPPPPAEKLEVPSRTAVEAKPESAVAKAPAPGEGVSVAAPLPGAAGPEPKEFTPEWVREKVLAPKDAIVAHAASADIVEPMVQSIVRDGIKKGATERAREKMSNLIGVFIDPEKRAQLNWKFVAFEKKLKEERGEDYTLTKKDVQGFLGDIGRKGIGEADIGRKGGQGVVEAAAAEAPAAVGKAEPVSVAKAGHYDFLKEQLTTKGSPLEQAGLKSVGQFVEQLPLDQMGLPKGHAEAFRDYVEQRDAGKNHNEAIDFIRQKYLNDRGTPRWSDRQAAVNAINKIFVKARTGQEGLVEKETGRRDPTPADIEELARERANVLDHLKAGIAAKDKDGISTALGGWLAHERHRGVFDLPKDNKRLAAFREIGAAAGIKAEAMAKKNGIELGEVLARHFGVPVKEVGVVAKEKAAPVVAALKEPAATAKKEGGRGPGGFEVMPTRTGIPGVRWKGPNGTHVSFLENEGMVRVEKVPEVKGAPDVVALRKDLDALRADPDVKVIDGDLPIKAQDSLLAEGGEGALKGFIADPDPPKALEKLGHERFRRISEMAAVEPDPTVHPSWAQHRYGDPKLPVENWMDEADAAVEDPKGALPRIKVELEKAGIKGLDPELPVRKMGAGTFHVVYDLPGAQDANGNPVVLRVGRSPSLPLTEQQAALMQPTLGKGILHADVNGEPLYYSVHPRGLIPADIIRSEPLRAIDEGDLFWKQLQAKTGRALQPAAYSEATADRIAASANLPPGVTLQEFFKLVGEHLTKASGAEMSISNDILSYKKPETGAPGPRQAKGFRGEQFAFIPVKAIDTRGVGVVDSNGRSWQLVAADYGMMTSRKWGGDPVTAAVNERNRIYMMEDKPVSRLSQRELDTQVSHYDEDARDATPIGEGLQSANHDRIASQEFVDRHGELGGSAAAALKKITETVTRAINDQYDRPGEGLVNVEYRGLTSSPFLAGLYHEPQGTSETGHIYTNVVEAVNYAKGDHEKAIDRLLNGVVHEITHNKNHGHGQSFQTYEEYVQNLLKAQEQMPALREQLKAAFPEETFRQVEQELVPEFQRLRRVHENRRGASWREEPVPGREGEGVVEGVPAGAAEGGLAAEPYRPGGVEEAPAGGGARGLRPGGDVSGGGLGEAGRVPVAAALGEPRAAGPAEAEAAGPAAGGDLGGQGVDPLRDIKRRISEYGTAPVSEANAKQLLTQMIDSVKHIEGKAPTLDSMHNWSWQLAGQLTDVLHPKDVALRAKSLPDPNVAKGQTKGVLNMLHFVDLPDKTKARVQIYGELMEGHWPKDIPQRWEDVEEEVHQMLGLYTPEQWSQHYRNQKGGPTPRDVLLMKQVNEELWRRQSRADQALADALVKPETTVEQVKALQDEVNRAGQATVQGMNVLAGGRTVTARALAIGRADVRAMDPYTAFTQDLRAAIRERVRAKLGTNHPKIEETTGSLFSEFMKQRDSTNPNWAEWQKAYRALIGSKLWPDKILEFYKAGLLGWPSRVANMTSNFLLRGVRMAEDGVSAALDAAGSKLTGEKRQLFLGESTVSLLAHRRAFAEAVPEWWGEMKRNAMLQPDNMVKSLSKGSMMEDLLQNGGAIGGKTGEFIRFHLKGMGADDAFAKHFIKVDNLYRQVYRKLRQGDKQFQLNPGESIAQGTERIVADLRTNWQGALDGSPSYDFAKIKLFQPMMEEAERAAKRETFQQELGPTAQSMQSFLRNNPLFQFIIPFYRTPINITKETLTRTPLGMLSTWRNWNKLSTAERAQELSRNLTGTLLGSGMLAYAMAGGSSGGGPLDPDERSMLESTGWQPYSVKLGNNYISYQRLEPIASILGVASDAAEGIRNGDFQSAQSGFMRVLQSVGENITNKTFLSGLDALTAAVSHPNQFAASFVKRMQASMVPNSLGYVPISGLTRAMDNTYRQTEPMDMSTFYAKLPFLSSTLEPQYSPSGEERKRPGTALEALISPFARVQLKEGPAQVGAEEVVRLAATPKAPRKYWLAPGGLKVDFQPEERKAMAVAMQNATQYIGERLIKDPTYLALPENEMDPRYRFGMKTKEDVIKNVYGKYRDNVMQRIKPALMSRGRKQVQERSL